MTQDIFRLGQTPEHIARQTAKQKPIADKNNPRPTNPPGLRHEIFQFGGCKGPKQKN